MYRTTKQQALKRGGLSAVVVLGALATGVGIAGASTHASATPHTNTDLTWPRDHGPGLGGLVTAVSSSSITVAGRPGTSPVTYAITGTTTVTKDGVASSTSNLAVGQHVAIVASTSSATTAASIEIDSVGFGRGVHGGGTVTAVTGTSVTVKDRAGTSSTYSIDPSTIFTKDRVAATATDLSVGDSVRVLPSSSSATTAARIDIELPHVAGKVVSVSGNTIEVTSRGGTNETIQVDSSTTYTKSGATSSLSSVTVGSFVFAQGVENTGHTALTASVVGIGQPIMGYGSFDGPFPGGGQRPTGPGGGPRDGASW